MLCKKPYTGGIVPVRCGRCLPCRVQARRIWTTRCVLESYCHEESAFVTLTYSEDQVPDRGNLRRRDVQLFLKRLRARVAPERFRLFGCGEYGDQTWRPHYHLLLFGLSPALGGVIEKAWGHGFVQVGECNERTAQYVAGYTMKKMTKRFDERLRREVDGEVYYLVPEFSMMSLKPGIGAPAMDKVGAAMCSDAGMDEIEALGDVVSQLQFGRKKVALGRYLRKVLRHTVGVPDTWIKEAMEAHYEEVYTERLLLHEAKKGDAGYVSPDDEKRKEDEGKVLSLEAKAKISRSKRSL